MFNVFSANVESDLQQSRSLSISKIRKLEKQISKKLDSISINLNLVVIAGSNTTESAAAYKQFAEEQVTTVDTILNLIDLKFSLRSKVNSHNTNIVSDTDQSDNSINGLLLAKEYYKLTISKLSNAIHYGSLSADDVTNAVNELNISNSRSAVSSYYRNSINLSGIASSLFDVISKRITNAERQILAIDEKVLEINNKKKVVLTPSDLQLCESNGILIPLS